MTNKDSAAEASDTSHSSYIIDKCHTYWFAQKAIASRTKRASIWQHRVMTWNDKGGNYCVLLSIDPGRSCARLLSAGTLKYHLKFKFLVKHQENVGQRAAYKGSKAWTVTKSLWRLQNYWRSFQRAIIYRQAVKKIQRALFSSQYVGILRASVVNFCIFYSRNVFLQPFWLRSD